MALTLGLQLAINRAKRIRHGSPTVVPKYYFSSTGDDANDGLSESLPKQTISELNSLVLEPGDIVGLKCGDSFEGTITIGQSGTSGNPITLTSYGTGAKPKIYGSEVITGWTLHSGNIWKATFGTDITQLFVSDVKMQVARYDNAGSMFNVTGVTSTTVFTSSELATQTDDYYNGATILIQGNEWTINTKSVTDYVASTKTFTINSALSYTLTTSANFVLVGKLEFLTEAGEWFYDTATNTVYLWKPDGTQPTDTEVRGSTIITGIDINAKNYITVKNLEITQFQEYGIKTNGTCANLTFDNNTITDIEDYGIYGVNEVSNSTYSNNTILRVNSIGILSGETLGDNCVITDNVITDIGLYENLGLHGYAFWRGHCKAIMTAGANTVIEYNRVINGGYIGLQFQGFNNSIRYNYFENTGQLLSDGGAIYTWSSDIAIPLVTGTVISNNIINGHGGNGAIYMDDRTQLLSITNNTIANSAKSSTNWIGGVYGLLLKGKDIDFSQNVIFNNPRGLYVNSVYSGLVLDSNIIVNTVSTPSSAGIAPLMAQANPSDFGDTDFDNNIYIDRTRTTVYRNATTNINFAAWQTEFGVDAASTFISTALNANETEQIFYNDTKVAKTFYLNNASNVANDATGASITTSFVLQPFTSIILRGINLSRIKETLDTDLTPPVISDFTIAATPTLYTIGITSFVATGSPTGYLITESAAVPLLTDANWSETPQTSYTFSTTGAKTLYAWAKDSTGNISASATQSITIDVVNVGTTSVLATTLESGTRWGQQVTFTNAATIHTLSIYHSNSTGGILLGVYSDSGSNTPGNLLGITEVGSAVGLGWATLNLETPITVTAGQKVWLAFVFENSATTFRYKASGAVYKNINETTKTYANGLDSPFGTGSVLSVDMSIYCTANQ